MALHPEIAAFLAALPHHEAGPVEPAILRADEEGAVPAPEDRLPLHSVEDFNIPSEVGAVPVRLYAPLADESSGVIVYLHGGAFFIGSLDTHDGVARSLAKETGLRVISVGYRLAPENPFPAGLDDCLAVVRWIAKSGASIGWDGDVLALVGDSSGGGFVATVAALAHDEGQTSVTHQVMFYPSLDLDFDETRYASLRENAVGYGLETAGLAPFNSFYLASGADPADPRVSPIKRDDFSGLPPALIITGEHDPLRDEGELYGELLARAGVPTTVTRYPGAGHGFVQHFSWIPEYHEAFEQTARFLTADPS